MRNLLLPAVLLLSGLAAAQETVEVIRDEWGVPHVFASSDAGAMYGLGWASAEDRAFQMYYALRIMQGRLAEVVGDVQRTNRRETAVQNDRKMRTFGFWRQAQRVATALDPESRALLQAYSDGVNAYVGAHRDDLPAPFRDFDVEPEAWTPAACLVSWWHLGQFFGTDGTRDLNAWRNRRDPRPGRAPPPAVAPDDDAAIVQRADVEDDWVARVEAFHRAHFRAREGDGGEGEGRKFSHAWVVGGAKTTTGAAVLCSDPQTPVTNPSLLYEFHVRGATFDARGVGVAGSPVILIGFNRHVAWGMTARGADQADLFRLVTARDHPDAYELDGEWRAMDVRTERILVRGGEAQELTVRETAFGPVVSEFAFVRRGDPQVALRRVPVCDTEQETIQGAIAMLRAEDVADFRRALSGWRFPTANCVYGDASGHIGYSTIGAMPIRSPDSESLGGAAHRGDRSRFDWQGFVPPELLPQVIDPARGYLLSANHRPIASFYAIPLGDATGVHGDTLRSWRLRERLSAKERFTPEEVLAIHFDATNPALREIVRLGVHLRDAAGIELQPDALLALEHLEPWLDAGASSDLRAPGAALATSIDLMFRRNATPLTERVGGGLSGLARLLKETRARIERDEPAGFGELEHAWVDRLLAGAWRSAASRFGRDPAQWEEHARAQVQRGRLGYYQGLDGFPTLDREQDLPLPALTCIDGNTIVSQRAQAYTQWVPLHDVDLARSICPPGQSERPGHPSRTSTLDLWERGALHPAPLSREAVERLRVSTESLRYRSD